MRWLAIAWMMVGVGCVPPARLVGALIPNPLDLIFSPLHHHHDDPPPTPCAETTGETRRRCLAAAGETDEDRENDAAEAKRVRENAAIRATGERLRSGAE